MRAVISILPHSAGFGLIENLSKMLIAVLPRAGSPVAQRLLSGAFWSLAGEVASRALTFLSAIVVARQLGSAEFGAFALVQSTITMLTIFAGFGMGHTASRYVAAYRASEPARIEDIANLAVTVSAVMGAMMTLLLYAAAPVIARDILHRPELAGMLRQAPPILLLSSVAGAANGILVGFEALSSIARNAWMSASVAFVAILAGVMTSGLTGAIAGVVVGEVFRCGLVLAQARDTLRSHRQPFMTGSGIKEARVIWEFGLPLLFNSMLFAPVTWVCQSIVARQPDGLHQLGLFDAAQKWMTLVILVPMSASSAFGPVLAGFSGSGEASRHKRVTLQLAAIQFALTAIPAALVAYFAPWSMAPFGESFSGGVPVVVLMMALAPIFVARHLYWQALTSSGRGWASLIVSVAWAFTAIALTWAWQDGGAWGQTKALLVAYGVSLAMNVIVIESGWRKQAMTELNDTLVRLFGWRGALFHGDTSVHDRWRYLARRLPRVRGTGERVLEVGCGTGGFTMGIASRGYEAVGLSWDTRNQGVAERRAAIAGVKNVTFPICDARELDRHAEYVGAFDVVVCCEVVEHIIDDRRLFRAMYACLKPGGRLYLTTPNYYYAPMSRGDMGPFSATEDGWHVRRGYSGAMLHELSGNAGFVVEEISHVSQFFSQCAIRFQRAVTSMLGHRAALIAVTPLRIVPPVLDGWLGKAIGRIVGWPGYSIALSAYKPREMAVAKRAVA